MCSETFALPHAAARVKTCSSFALLQFLVVMISANDLQAVMRSFMFKFKCILKRAGLSTARIAQPTIFNNNGKARSGLF